MARVGELSFDFVIDANSIGSSFSAVENRVGQLESRLKGVGNSGISVNTRDAESSVGGLTEKVGLLTNALKGVAVGTGFMAVQVGANAIGQAWNFAKEAAIGYNDFQNGALKGFAAFLGSEQAAVGFMKQLSDFANSTPFEIKGLVTSSQQLLAFGFNAKQIIPILEDVGNTSAAFHRGQEGINAMTYALGQMNVATVVHTQDLYQLLNVGVPVWDILSEGMHKTVPEIKDMVEKGQIASSTFIELFDTWAHGPKIAGQMAAANQTLEGSMSTIHDVAQKVVSDGFKPLYDVIVMVANKAAAFASGGGLEEWGNRISAVVSMVIDYFKKIPEAWDAIATFISQNGGIVGALEKVGGNILTWIGGLAERLVDHAPEWVQAGATLVESFASGMWAAVTGTVQGVINAIADFIGGFFIGQSPPPMGPLHDIEDAGRTLMGTYAEGMQGGLDAISSIPDAIMEMLTSIDSKGILDNLTAGITAGTLGLDDLKVSAGFAGDALDALNGAEQQLGYQIDSVKMQIDDIKGQYDDQINQLQTQVDLMAQQVDYQQQMVDLNLQLQDVNIRIDMHNDQNLKNLEAQQKQAQQAMRGLSGGSQSTDPLTRHLQDLQHQLQSLPNDAAHKAQRDAIQKTISDLQYQKQQEDNLAKDQRANAQQNLDNITNQVNAIKDGYQARQDDIKFQRDGITLDQEKGKIISQIAQNPLLEKQAKLKSAEDAQLEPLNRQLDALNRQKQHLDDQKKIWDDIKKLADSTVSAMEKAAKALEPKAGGGGGGKAGGGLKMPEGGAGGLHLPGEKELTDGAVKILEKTSDQIGKQIQDKAREWGQKALDGFVKFIGDNWGHIVGAAIGGVLGSALGPVGSIIGSLLGGQVGESLQKRLEGVPWDKVFGKLQEVAKAVGERLGEFFTLVRDHWPDIVKFAETVGTLAKNIGEGLLHAAEFILPILVNIGKFFVEHIEPISKVAAVIGLVVGAIAALNGIAAIGAAAAGLLAGGIGALGTAIAVLTSPVTIIIAAIAAVVAVFILLYTHNKTFHDFVDQRLLPALKAIGGFVGGQLMAAWHTFSETMTTRVIPAAKELATWFMDHIWPALQRVGGFIINTVIPAFVRLNVMIAEQVIETIKNLASWINEHILPALESFGSFIQDHVLAAWSAFTGWLEGTLFPALGRLHEWFDKTLMPVIRDFGELLSITVLPAIQGAWNVVWTVLQAVWETIGKPIFDSVAAGMHLIWDVVQAVWPDVSHLIGIVMSEIGTIVRTGWDIVTGIMGPVMSELGSIVRAAWETIKTVVDTGVKIIGDIIRLALDVLKGNWRGAWDDIKKLLSDTWNGIQSLVKIALDLVVATIHNTWDALSNVVEAIWNGVKSTIGNAWDAIGTIIHGALEAIKTALKDAFDYVHDSIITPAWNAIKAIFDLTKDAVVESVLAPFKLAQTGAQALWSEASGIWGDLKKAWDGIKKMFTDAKDEVAKAITAPFEAARDAFEGIFSSIKSKIQTPFNEIGTGIHSVLDGLRNGINWLAGKFDLPEIGAVPDIHWAAKGVVDFEGGPAIVGEKGWELGIIDGKAVRLGAHGPEFIPHLPEHATVVPHELSERLVRQGAVPGFAGGLNFDWLGSALDVIKGGADWLWTKMLDHFVTVPKMDQRVFGDLSKTLIEWVKDHVIKWIKGGLDKLLPVSPDQLQAMVRFADAQQGLPYIWGGGHGSGGAGIGFDCSGFVAAVLDAGGIPNPHGIVTAFYEWMQQGRSGVVDIGIESPYAAPDVQHTGIGLMGQWYESGGRAGGAGRTSDYFPIVGRPPGFPEQARGSTDAAQLAWKNILERRVGQLGGTDYPPLSALPAAMAAVRAYANGGLITEPVDGMGRWSGARYSFGERGIETVRPGGGSGDGFHIHGDVTVEVTPPDNVGDPEAWGEKVGDGFVKHMRYVKGKAG